MVVASRYGAIDMVNFIRNFFLKPALVQASAADRPEREKLTQKEVMEHFDCGRFQGPTASSFK